MSNWFVLHEGSGTWFSLDDTAYIINAENLDEEEVEMIEWLEVPEGTPVIAMSSELVDEWISK